MNSINIKLIFLVLVLFIKAQEPFLFAQTSTLEKKGHRALNTGKLDSAKIYYQSARNEYFEEKKFGEYVMISNYLGYVFYEANQIDSFKIYTVQSFAEAKKYLPPNHQAYLRAFANLNSYYFNKCDYKKALEINQDIIQYKKNNKDYDKELASAYQNLGNCYRQLEDNKSALQYLILAQEVSDSIKDYKVLEYNINQSIARIYVEQKNLIKAKELYSKGEQIAITTKNVYKIHHSLLLMAEIEALTANFLKAFDYVEKAKKILLEDPYARIRRQETLGLIYLNRGDHQSTINSITKAQALAQSENKRMVNAIQIERYMTIAKAGFAIGNLDMALDFVQRGIQLFSTIDMDSALEEYTNPPLKNFYNVLDGFDLLSFKSKLLAEKYKKHPNLKFLEKSLETGLLAIKLNKSVRRNIFSDDSKLEISTESSLLFQQTFETCYTLFNLTQKQEYKMLLFEIAEKSKASLLLEDFLYSLANQNDIIPDSIINIEKNIQNQIASLNKEIFENKSNQKETKNYESELATLNSELDLLIGDLERNYPLYYQTKYNTQVIGLDNLQTSLGKNKTEMIEYFIGTDYLYGLFISPTQFEPIRLSINDVLLPAVDSLQLVLHDEVQAKSAIEEFQLFTSSALSLYDSILKPLLSFSNPEINSITIIPDGYLSFIPFESLITSQPKGIGYDLDNLDYVLENHSISYEYSATFFDLNNNKTKSKKNLSFVGFAPSFLDDDLFSCHGSSTQNLICNSEEVQQLAVLTRGKALIDAEASSSQMMELIKQYDIIHLATHTCIDISDQQNHQIYFTDNSLSSIEIENLQLDNEMVVLSACNTGQGKLYEGEGVFSLARGFLNAGCKSVLMSLWAVDDCSTSTMMQLFYKNLAAGKKKDEALRLAKLKYLKSSSKLKQHPSLWSPFIAYGNMREVKINTSNNKIPYLFLFITLILAIYLLRSYRKQKN